MIDYVEDEDSQRVITTVAIETSRATNGQKEVRARNEASAILVVHSLTVLDLPNTITRTSFPAPSQYDSYYGKSVQLQFPDISPNCALAPDLFFVRYALGIAARRVALALLLLHLFAVLKLADTGETL